MHGGLDLGLLQEHSDSKLMMCLNPPSGSSPGHLLQQRSPTFTALRTGSGGSGGVGEGMVLYACMHDAYPNAASCTCALAHFLHSPVPKGLQPSSGPWSEGRRPLSYSVDAFENQLLLEGGVLAGRM